MQNKATPLAIKHIEFLKLLKTLSPHQKSNLYSLLPNELINTFSEICSNFLNQRIPINKTKLRKLAKNRDIIHSLSLKKTSLKKKRKLLKTRKGGGVFSVLIPLAITAITSLLSSRK